MPLPRSSGDALVLAQEIVQQGIAASRSGDKRRARELLTQAVQIDPQNEQAWLWLSDTMTDAVFRRICLEKVLAINPNNAVARRGLQALVEPTPAPPDPAPEIAIPEPELPPAPPAEAAGRDYLTPQPASIHQLLRPSNSPPVHSSAPPAPQVLTPVGAQCPWCGARIASRLAVDCPSCEHPLEFECPGCGESLPLELQQCPRCGHVMGDFARQREAYLSKLGEAYRERGLAASALPVYRYLLEMKPESAVLRIRLAELYGRLEKTEEAAAEAERAVELDPQNPEALYVLGHWYIQSGRQGKAGELAAQLSGMQNRPLRLTLLLGDLEYARREYPAALRAYRLATGAKGFDKEFDAPTRAMVHYRLGEMYRLADDLQLALKAYQACRDTQADLHEVVEAGRWVDLIRPPLPPQAARSHVETLRAMAGPLLFVWLTGASAIGFRFQRLTVWGALGMVGALAGSYLFACAMYTPLTGEWREMLGEAGLTLALPRRIALAAGGGLLIFSLALVLFGM
jgi:tetratricopeptide (TPR) repeat protein